MNFTVLSKKQGATVMESIISRDLFAWRDDETEREGRSSLSISSLGNKPFRFELPTDDRTNSTVLGGRRGLWRDNSHRRFCSLEFGRSDIQAAVTTSPCLAFNNKFSVSLLHVSPDCEEGTYVKVRNISKNSSPLDYYSSMNFDQAGAPLLSLATYFEGVEVFDFQKQKGFVKIKEKGVECLGFFGSVMVTAKHASALRFFDLREGTIPVSLVKFPLLDNEELLNRLDYFGNSLSLDTNMRTVLFDMRNFLHPSFHQKSTAGLTFLSHKSIYVNAITNTINSLFLNDIKKIEGNIIDVSFNRVQERLLLLCCKGENQNRLIIFDDDLSVRNEINLPLENFKKCAFFNNEFSAVISKTSVSAFSLEGCGSPF